MIIFNHKGRFSAYPSSLTHLSIVDAMETTDDRRKRKVEGENNNDNQNNNNNMNFMEKIKSVLHLSSEIPKDRAFVPLLHLTHLYLPNSFNEIVNSSNLPLSLKLVSFLLSHFKCIYRNFHFYINI